MRNIGVRIVSVVALAVGVGLGATACTQPAPNKTDIVEVSWHTSKSIPNYQGLEGTSTDQDHIDDLAALIDKTGWHPGAKLGGNTDGCTGGLAGTITFTDKEGKEHEIMGYQCGGAENDFDNAVIDLVQKWG